MTTPLKKSDLHHILDALECAEAEFEELMNEREWYVTSVVDRIQSAKQLVIEELGKHAGK